MVLELGAAATWCFGKLGGCPMLLALLAAVVPTGLAAVGPATDDASAVQLWINNNRRFRPGEAVRVQVEMGRAGYLVVLQYDPEGQLRVLFPLSPEDDAFVEAGRRYEVRDYEHDQSFVATGSGPGLIYAAVAPEPFRFEGFRSADRWDYGVLKISQESRDPEADITELVQRMAPPDGFDYDLLDYVVAPPATRVVNAPPPPSWWSPTWWYYDDWYYDSWWDPYSYSCFSCGYGYRSGFFLHIGLGTPWFWYYPSYWYRPWYYYYYRPHGFYAPYWVNRPFYYPGRPVVVIPRGDYPRVLGRSRGYVIERDGSLGGRGSGGTLVGGRTERPAPAADARPPARRARGERPSGDAPAPSTVGRPAPENRQPTTRPEGTRARGGRPRGGGSEAATQAPRPLIETSRPREPTREWMRVNDDPVIERTRGGRDVVAERPEARRVERGSAPVWTGRTRGEVVERGDRGNRAGSVVSREPPATEPPEPGRVERSRSEPRAAPRPSSSGPTRASAPSGGSRPSFSAPRGGGSRPSASRPSGGGGGRARGRG
jgi:hypothetical protein